MINCTEKCTKFRTFFRKFFNPEKHTENWMNNMAKRLEVEIEDSVKNEIDVYAKKKGIRRPFAYGLLLEIGLRHKQIEDKEDKPNA